MRWLAAAVAALLCCAPLAVSAFHFYLEPGASRCFLEQLPKDTLVVGNYKSLIATDAGDFAERPDIGVVITVVELTTRHLLLKLRKENIGRFAFTSNEAGDHEICLRTNQTTWLRTSQKAKLYLDLTIGEAGNSNAATSTQEKLSSIASNIRDVSSRVIDIRREQQFQKEQEEIFRDTSEGLNSRVVWFMLLQIVVLVITSALQLRHLTVFFHTKKVA